ncbi:MAG TPA: hypothetical protein VN848_02855 [Gemmatimonadales bacterium]|nr:hypothetical protein [Gemmatimonadales bacterium]
MSNAAARAESTCEARSLEKSDETPLAGKRVSGGRRLRAACFAVLVMSVAVAARLAGQGPGVDADLEHRARAAVQWLEQQVTPNRVVPDPDATRRGLLVSYAFTPRQFPSGYHRSATYDNAVAALAFLLSGNRERAAVTLDGLARLVRPDGSLWFNYNTADSWPTEADHESALVRAGSVAWVGYALIFYLAHVPLQSADPGDARERAAFLAAARRLGTYLASLQVNEPGDARDGLLHLGYGSIALTYDSVAKNVVEHYDDRPALGISTENNIIAWFFLRRLSLVTGDTLFARVAGRIERSLRTVAWNARLGQFNQGFGPTGVPDSNKALDCAALGALFLEAHGDSVASRRALAAAERFYRSRDGTTSGYRPYGDRPIYEDRAVSAFFFPGRSGLTWQELPVVWSEGSLQVALAYLRAGRRELARRIVEDLGALQAPDGGVRYASTEVPYEMAKVPSVAGSAWLVMMAAAIRGDTMALDILR